MTNTKSSDVHADIISIMDKIAVRANLSDFLLYRIQGDCFSGSSGSGGYGVRVPVLSSLGELIGGTESLITASDLLSVWSHEKILQRDFHSALT